MGSFTPRFILKNTESPVSIFFKKITPIIDFSIDKAVQIYYIYIRIFYRIPE